MSDQTATQAATSRVMEFLDHARLVQLLHQMLDEFRPVFDAAEHGAVIYFNPDTGEIQRTYSPAAEAMRDAAYRQIDIAMRSELKRMGYETTLWKGYR